MSKLKAHDPKTTDPSKPKMVIYGESGVGKTWFALEFPNVYFIDCESGATRSHYMERLTKSGGAYLGTDDGSNEFETIIEQVKALSTEKHNYKTLVIDSITKVFNSSITAEAERLGEANAFGADKKPAIQYMRRLIKAVERLDMNVVFIAHSKSEWGLDKNGVRSEIGKIPDAHEKLIYELDLALNVTKKGDTRFAFVKKSRILAFPDSDTFLVTFDEFSERYGKEVIQKKGALLQLAAPEQVSEITRLVELLKIDQDTVNKWLDKANAETIYEFTSVQAGKIIEQLKLKIK
jgi:RecA-family ATPase